MHTALRVREKTGLLGIRIMGASEATYLPRTVVSVSKHNKNPFPSVGLEQRSLYCIIPRNNVMSLSLCSLLFLLLLLLVFFFFFLGEKQLYNDHHLNI